LERRNKSEKEGEIEEERVGVSLGGDGRVVVGGN